TKAFWRARADAPEGELVSATPSALLEDDSDDIAFADRSDVGRMPIGMVVPTAALIGVGLVLTIWAGPVFGFSDRAAGEVLDRNQYIFAVVGQR
ncbi:MAG: Na+/H+ antiporter subunit D, partial [Mycobacterium sp.]